MPPPRALRLFFSYRWPEIVLESADEVDMTPPPADPVERSDRTSGFWYELRDKSGKALYRRASQSPIRTSAEILTDDREKPIVREEISDLAGHFVLIAPNLPEASTVALMGTQPRADSLAEPAEELAQFDLQTRRRIS